jgi:para-nitrobenzyl esterase
MSQADGLYRRAIAQSGGADKVHSRATAEKVTTALATSLGIAPTAEAFAQVPLPTLITAQTALSDRIRAEPNPLVWGEIVGNGMAYEPCVDGEVLTAVPIDAIAAGAGTASEVLIGTNDDEHTFFFVPTGVHTYLTEDALHALLAGYGRDVETATAAYREADPDASPAKLFMDVMRDEFFRVPAVRVAEARHAHGLSAYVYEFGWRTPQFNGGLGATHALEIGFVFDNLGDPNGKPLTGDAPPQALADEMHAAWVAFVATGDPGWPAYGTERTVRRFGGANTGVVQDPAPALRAVWDGAV